jgi:hypothetical protein
MTDFTVIISALVMGNFGIKIFTNENKALNYSVLSPYDYKDGKYIFGSKNLTKEYLWHEIAHTAINDLTKEYIDQFTISGKTISDKLINAFYNNIEAIINEYIIRSITIRLFELDGENEFAGYLTSDNIQKGFKAVEAVKEYIKENCEQDCRFMKHKRYKYLMEYIVNMIY